ncbi:MAG: purine-nucleoside phosphorylase [Deltaproteobacteria bacterium]|nr:purine-nucleoside phosphorylase [Deltaproteobacteria bacterium]
MLKSSGIDEAVAHLRARILFEPALAIVLGSGLAGVADALADARRIPLDEIPGYPTRALPGHVRELVAGRLDDVGVLAFAGRVHLYEGWDYDEVTWPVQLAYGLGVRRLVLTTSVGGIGERLRAGAAMLFRDHINLQGGNPVRTLVQKAVEADPAARPFAEEPSPFADMGAVYDVDALPELADEAEAVGVRVTTGVLAGVLGPVYETPAEIGMLRALGADAVCMSTVPEAIMARYLGMRTAALGLITNVHGASADPLTHDEVVRQAGSSGEAMTRLVLRLARYLAREE